MKAWLKRLIANMAEALIIAAALLVAGALVYRFREWLMELGRRLQEWAG